jgi:hypothetical protein
MFGRHYEATLYIPMAFLFLLNPLGNLLAKTIFEKSLAVITLMLFISNLCLALEKRKAPLE